MKTLIKISFLFFVNFAHSYETKEYYFPNADKNMITAVGDTVISTRIGTMRDCIIPRKEFVNENRLWRFTYKKDIPLCKADINHKYYTPTYDNYYAKGVGDNKLPVTLKKNKNDKFTLCQKTRTSCVKDLTEEDIEINKVFIADRDYLQKQIIYLGKSGNILKFLAEEYGRAVPFEIDISQTNIVTFKGAIIEIISHSNSEIEYKKIKHYSD